MPHNGAVSADLADDTGTPAPAAPPRARRRGLTSIEALALLLVFGLTARPGLTDLFAAPVAQAWSARFVAVCVQAFPFLVLGVALSAAISAFVPADFFHKAVPKRTALAVPVAGVAGAVLPACECASVPVAGALVRRGVAPAAAFTFMLASPAINPIVVVSTFVAFPGNPEMVAARVSASLLAAVTIGWLWAKLGKTEWLRLPQHRHHEDGRWAAFWDAIRHDFLHAGGYLVIGAAIAASLNTLVPETWLAPIADDPVLGVLALAVLAVLVSICSESDAFVAASLTQFSPTAKLAFMVVGPFIDVKLAAMQAGTFGRRFAARFAPAAFIAAVAAAVLMGAVWL
ncbi:permease [Glycomyces terrestris]|uniref:Permease n=1 Tax=Glycomyces terrestris TaxID=2493553 RepID=A0A426UUN7_9ACTN|nr:permease [Glycomyces terrestris]